MLTEAPPVAGPNLETRGPVEVHADTSSSKRPVVTRPSPVSMTVPALETCNLIAVWLACVPVQWWCATESPLNDGRQYTTRTTASVLVRWPCATSEESRRFECSRENISLLKIP